MSFYRVLKRAYRGPPLLRYRALLLAEPGTYLPHQQLPSFSPGPWPLLLSNRTGEGSSINSIRSSKSENKEISRH